MNKILVLLLLLLVLFLQKADAALKVTPTLLELNANDTRGNYLTASFDVQGDDRFE